MQHTRTPVPLSERVDSMVGVVKPVLQLVHVGVGFDKVPPELHEPTGQLSHGAKALKYPWPGAQTACAAASSREDG